MDLLLYHEIWDNSNMPSVSVLTRDYWGRHDPCVVDGKHNNNNSTTFCTVRLPRISRREGHSVDEGVEKTTDRDFCTVLFIYHSVLAKNLSQSSFLHLSYYYILHRLHSLPANSVQYDPTGITWKYNCSEEINSKKKKQL